MNARDIDFANAQAKAVEAHDETQKYSVVTTDQLCPDCKRAMLVGEVLEVNDQGYRYEVDVRCKSACGPARVFRI